ncbi:MAG TPA: glucokinase [Desulfomonilaceae bacterium]|nr:glucokinase [Desulfomonilaceae bacterium]
MQDPQSKIALAGDIGGTKTNLGLFRKKEPKPELLVMKSYSSVDATDLSEMIADFIAAYSGTIESACFGVAGPVLRGKSKITQLKWEASEEDVKKRFKWEKVKLVNDLTATAYAIPILDDSDIYVLNEAPADLHGTVGIVAPGTGLGISLVHRRNGEMFPLPSEGGHADFAPVTEEQVAFWRYLRSLYGHVSLDRVISGPGIHSVYRWLRESSGQQEPAWLTDRMKHEDPSAAITESALVEKEPLCVHTLELFVSMLGSVSGNIALTGLTTGGIYLGGGIPPRILQKIKEGAFMVAFVDKGRFRELLARIPVHVILTNMAALIGAAHHAFRL